MKTPEQVVQEQVEAYNARDLEAFLGTYADDALLEEWPSGRRVAAGREAMRGVYGPLFRDTPALHCRIADRIVHGNIVVDRESVTVAADRDPLAAVAVYEVADGAIRRVLFLRA